MRGEGLGSTAWEGGEKGQTLEVIHFIFWMIHLQRGHANKSNRHCNNKSGNHDAREATPRIMDKNLPPRRKIYF